MKIRELLAFNVIAIAMVCLLMLALTAQRAGVIEAHQATAVVDSVSSASAVSLARFPHDSAELGYTSVISLYLPIIVKDYKPPPSFIWPIAGAPDSPYLVCDAFGPRLNKDIYDWHRGIDIKGVTCTTDVRASTSGQVRISANSVSTYTNCGQMIQIQYPDLQTSEYRTNYCHLCKREVEVNDYVEQGDVIGKVGADKANWSHLHFEIRKGDTPQNPYCYLPYSDLNHHSIEISRVVTSSLPISISVSLLVTTPREELDINEVRVRVLALDAGGVEKDNKYVNFNEEHNCGTDSNCVTDTLTQICIYPQHFWCDVPTWTVGFTFTGLVASDSVQVLAEVMDCKGAVKQDSWTSELTSTYPP